MDVTGLADPYVKIYLLCNSQRISKKKTHVKKRTLSPIFNESFVFEIPIGAVGLADITLEFMLLDWDRLTKNEVSFLPFNSPVSFLKFPLALIAKIFFFFFSNFDHNLFVSCL